MAKRAWKVGPELIDRFLNVLDDNGFKWMSGHRANELKPMWKNATILFIKEKRKTLVWMRYWYYQIESDEEYNIIEVTEKWLDEMGDEGVTIVHDDEQVNHPRHYNHCGIETIDIIKAMLTEKEYHGYLKGNILKYRERAQHKGKPDEDYAKALWYYDELTRGR